MRCTKCTWYAVEGDLYRCYAPVNIYHLFFGTAFIEKPAMRDWDEKCPDFERRNDEDEKTV